ncbi:MAG: TraY domain-containing protein [Enhydrobacter sp.]|nr:TraY domain-containing protein [Enhydrobacter sp.]
MARKGRPTKAAKPGTKASLGLKVTASLKARLEEAAATSGRTQSQEAEYRLEQSFNRTDLLLDAMRLGYGAQAAGLILLVARAMTDAGRVSALTADPFEFANAGWIGNRFAYEQAVSAAVVVLKAFQPPGPMVKSFADAEFVKTMDGLAKRSNSSNWGEWFGKNLLNALSGDEESTVKSEAWIENMKALLGPLVERISPTTDTDR